MRRMEEYVLAMNLKTSTVLKRHGSRMKSLVAGTVDRLRIQLLEEITDSRFQANIGFHRAAVGFNLRTIMQQQRKDYERK